MAGNATFSQQPRFSETRGSGATPVLWAFMEGLAARGSEIPHWGQPGRGTKLRILVREEPFLSGAVATLVSKVAALDWQVSGGRNRVARYHALLGEAEDGAGWSHLLDPWVQDYLTLDMGGVLELGRAGRDGPVAGLYHLDANRLTLTGDVKAPIVYAPAAGDRKPRVFRPIDFSRIVDMRSPDEARRGLGLSAVSRALKASQLLLALYRYEEEQLSDLPPQGIAAITGLTMAEVGDAFELYEAKRRAKEELTFKGVLFMAAQQNPLQQIGVTLTPFSTLPAHWDRQQVVTQYIYTLALDFGVDPREFWPVSQGTLGSGREAEIQAEKAKGKGFGQLISKIERSINWDVLPEGLEFSFDLRDSEDDLLRARIQSQVAQSVRQLWEPALGFGGGLLSTEEARRLLAEQGVLPEWAGALGEIVTETVAAKAARANLAPGEDFVAINRAGDVIRLWPPRAYVAGGWPAADKAARPAGPVDPLDDARRAAEAELAAALYAHWAGLLPLVLAALEAERADLLAAQVGAAALKAAAPQAERIELAGARAVRAKALDGIDWGAEEERLRLALGELLARLVADALAATTVATVAISWEIYEAEAAALAAHYGFDLIRLLAASTRQQLGALIARWIAASADFSALVEDVRRLIPINPYPNVRDRAQLIAATEVTRIYADARAANFRAAGLTQMVWRTAEDELVCPICRPLGTANGGEGAVGTLAGGFQVPGSELIVPRPPAHPGCRCWIVESVAELEALTGEEA